MTYCLLLPCHSGNDWVQQILTAVEMTGRVARIDVCVARLSPTREKVREMENKRDRKVQNSSDGGPLASLVQNSSRENKAYQFHSKRKWIELARRRDEMRRGEDERD